MERDVRGLGRGEPAVSCRSLPRVPLIDHGNSVGKRGYGANEVISRAVVDEDDVDSDFGGNLA